MFSPACGIGSIIGVPVGSPAELLEIAGVGRRLPIGGCYAKSGGE